MFTYNSPLSCATATGSLWAAFLEFLTALGFAAKWTATLDQSLHSQVEGRVHLHVFMEFAKPVDWTALEPVRFRNSRPDAKPTIARGENPQDVATNGVLATGRSRPALPRAMLMVIAGHAHEHIDIGSAASGSLCVAMLALPPTRPAAVQAAPFDVSVREITTDPQMVGATCSCLSQTGAGCFLQF